VSPARARGSDRFATAGRSVSDDECCAAARLVGRVARDDADREQLLAALGLDTRNTETT
jgi:hypothetical protein